MFESKVQRSTVGPFFAPKARPAPQPARAFVQMDFVPRTRSVTHSRAVYTATGLTNPQWTTTKHCHRSGHALSLEVCVSHRLLQLSVTITRHGEPQTRQTPFLAAPGPWAATPWDSSSEKASPGRNRKRLPYRRLWIISRGESKPKIPPVTSLIKQELFTSPTFFGIKLKSSLLHITKSHRSVLDGGTDDKPDGLPIRNLFH